MAGGCSGAHCRDSGGIAIKACRALSFPVTGCRSPSPLVGPASPAGLSGCRRPAWRVPRPPRWPPSAACCSGGGRRMPQCRTLRQGRTAAASWGLHLPHSFLGTPTSTMSTTWKILSSLMVPSGRRGNGAPCFAPVLPPSLCRQHFPPLAFAPRSGPRMLLRCFQTCDRSCLLLLLQARSWAARPCHMRTAAPPAAATRVGRRFRQALCFASRGDLQAPLASLHVCSY
jgi:hypothetical protein